MRNVHNLIGAQLKYYAARYYNVQVTRPFLPTCAHTHTTIERSSVPRVLTAIFLITFLDHLEPVIKITKPDTRRFSIMFYHPNFNHEVDTVVWHLNIRGSLQKHVQYLTHNSGREAVYPEYGISIQSTCDYQSILTIPNDFNLNGTEVWCEVYTEICPEKWTTSNKIVITGMCIMFVYPFI